MPVYNEATVISDVVRDVRSVFPTLVCVDDGSRDASARLAEDAGAVVVRHPINLGQGAALQSGIDYTLTYTDADFLVTFDADGQHRTSDALAMVRLLAADEADVVFGSRFLDELPEVSGLKKAVLQLAVRYTNLTTGLRLSDAHNGLRALNRDAASSIHLTHHGMAHASEIVHQLAVGSWRIQESPVHVLYTDYSRAKGQSLWNSINILFDLVLR